MGVQMSAWVTSSAGAAVEHGLNGTSLEKLLSRRSAARKAPQPPQQSTAMSSWGVVPTHPQHLLLQTRIPLPAAEVVQKKSICCYH